MTQFNMNMDFLGNVLDSANTKCIKKHSMSIYSYCGLKDEDTDLIKTILIDPIVSSAFNKGAMNLVGQLRTLVQHISSITGLDSEIESRIREIYSNRTLYHACRKVETHFKESQNVDEAADYILRIVGIM